MNCKPGDLAIIVMCPRGTEHLRGKILRLTTLAAPQRQHPGFAIDTTAAWHYEGPTLRTRCGSTIEVVNDCCLRPIRADDREADDVRQPDLLEA